MMTALPISIRPIATDDLAEAASLHSRTLDTGWAERDLRLAAEDPAHLVWVAEHDGRLTGLIAARIVVDEAELLTLVVDGRDQGRGIGRRLCETLLASVTDHDVRRVFLEVAADNIRAIALYDALGFTPTGRRQGYYARPGQTAIDALTMTFHVA